jgi:hypothetical protein
MCGCIWIVIKFMFMYAETFFLKVLTSSIKNVRYQTLEAQSGRKYRIAVNPGNFSDTSA